jgi:hypothetical protein
MQQITNEDILLVGNVNYLNCPVENVIQWRNWQTWISHCLVKKKKKKKKLSRLYIKLKLNRPFRHCTSLVVHASMTGKMLKLYQEVFHRWHEEKNLFYKRKPTSRFLSSRRKVWGNLTFLCWKQVVKNILTFTGWKPRKKTCFFEDRFFILCSL